MKNKVYIRGDYILSPLGAGSQANAMHVRAGISGIRLIRDEHLLPTPFYAAILEDDDHWYTSLKNRKTYTRLEKLMIRCLQGLLQEHGLRPDGKTLLIISSTKGNISLLQQQGTGGFPRDRIHLSAMADAICGYFGISHPALVVSNACISGSLALSVAAQLLQSEHYNDAIVLAGDEISRFILTGFHSFQALADGPCRPYDRDRSGLNLGEAIAAVYLTKEQDGQSIEYCGSGSCNDANHISGPSRTGEGQYRSIQRAFKQAAISKVDFISAHGTATPYNDEMEAIALHRSQLEEVPLHSLKGYYGHTLGASGLLETILGIHFLKDNWLPASLGYENPGTSYPLNISKNVLEKPLNTFLKLASGFGGCNIATIFKKT